MNLAEVPKWVIFSACSVVEEHLALAGEGRAVVEQQRGAAGEAGNQPVPHHPAAGREVEQAVAGAHVAVQLMFLQMLQQHPAVAMDDAFGHAGRAAGEHDEERVIEADTLKITSFWPSTAPRTP
jgi:hypothetical protein